MRYEGPVALKAVLDIPVKGSGQWGSASHSYFKDQIYILYIMLSFCYVFPSPTTLKIKRLKVGHLFIECSHLPDEFLDNFRIFCDQVFTFTNVIFEIVKSWA